MSRGYSLRRRLLASLLLAFGLGIGATAAFYCVEVGLIQSDLETRTLRSQLEELLASFRIAGDGKLALDLPETWAEAYARTDSPFHYTIYDASRRVVATSPKLAPPLPFPASSQRQPFDALYFVGAGAARLTVVAGRAPGGHVAVVGRDRVPEETLAWSLIEENLEYLALVVVPFAIVALGLIWLVSTWSLRPIARASREAAAIAPGNLTERITARGLPNEIRGLVDAVNGALDRLTDVYAAERRLTADAAHQLRTPLAVLSLRLQRAKLDGAVDWPTIEREMRQMGRLVGQLLDLARKESAERIQPVGRERVNLSRLAREAAAVVLPMAEIAGRPIEVDAPMPVAVRGREDDLRDMISNLLDNALAHGGGPIRVAVRYDSCGQGRFAHVEVSDEGPGVPEALQEAVFKRFHKGAAGSPGAGLGLAIVHQVVVTHGGAVRFLPGSGCRVRVSLPARDTVGIAEEQQRRSAVT